MKYQVTRTFHCRSFAFAVRRFN